MINARFEAIPPVMDLVLRLFTMKLNNINHLAYCTNIHPAETWAETWDALKLHTLTVRDNVLSNRTPQPFAIGLRLSALAVNELLEGEQLTRFEQWLEQENCYVFTINGFPYGAFHGTEVKENVYLPDWTAEERFTYTCQMFQVIARLCPQDCGGSVSSLPGSFKEFEADETAIFENLYRCAQYIAELSKKTGKDLHLGLEPEPLGHFENTEETLAFFQRFLAWAPDTEIIYQHIGINYDTCHFALEFELAKEALASIANAGLRISKIHLSNALSVDMHHPEALSLLKQFEEPTYLHQVITKSNCGTITRYRDLPEFFQTCSTIPELMKEITETRVHFHIPLYAEPSAPLGSTRSHAEEVFEILAILPELCRHIEMETYTWGVLPDSMQQPITDQLAEEYRWTLARIKDHRDANETLTP